LYKVLEKMVAKWREMDEKGGAISSRSNNASVVEGRRAR
jgi:hypothetical protein